MHGRFREFDEEAEDTLSEYTEVDAWLVSCPVEDGSIPGTVVEKANGLCEMPEERVGSLEQRG